MLVGNERQREWQIADLTAFITKKSVGEDRPRKCLSYSLSTLHIVSGKFQPRGKSAFEDGSGNDSRSMEDILFDAVTVDKNGAIENDTYVDFYREKIAGWERENSG